MKKFPNAQSSNTLFQSIKKINKIHDNNILIKLNTSLRNPMVLLDNVEIDYETINKVKKFDYTKSFCLNPTQVKEKLGREFDISPSELVTNIEMERDILFKPSNMQINREINDANIKEFLMKKVKRHRTSKTEKNLPVKIQSLIKSYGDVCANINNETASKYQERNSIQII